MAMSDEKLIAKAAAALERHLPEGAYEHGCRFMCGYDGTDLDIHLGAAVVAAVEPLIREQIAKEIEASIDADDDMRRRLGLHQAARIARGDHRE